MKVKAFFAMTVLILITVVSCTVPPDAIPLPDMFCLYNDMNVGIHEGPCP